MIICARRDDRGIDLSRSPSEYAAGLDENTRGKKTFFTRRARTESCRAVCRSELEINDKNNNNISLTPMVLAVYFCASSDDRDCC